jgi:putative ABC transport system ATP-binding protein
MSEILRVQNLEKTFEKKGSRINAVSVPELTIEKGDFIALQGPSGSGKTTLLNILGLLDRPTSGKVMVEEVDVSNMAKKELSRMRAGKIGFVFQDFNLIPIFSALENVELPMMTTGVPRAERKQKALGLLETVGLSARGQHRPDELSAGEQQRVAIARALANGPAIILADEPTGNLDTENGLRIMNLLGQLNSGLGTTIVMVTHDDRMARLAKRRLHLKDGQIVGAS